MTTTVPLMKAVGVAENANLRHRARMEDRHVVKNPLVEGSTESSFIAVYDGHGGREAADFAAETLHKNLMSELQLNPTGGAAGAGGPQALDTAFLTTDSQMKLCVPQNCGTTAVAALLARKEGDVSGDRVLHVANCGDARAVLCKDMLAAEGPETIRLSVDHKPGDPEERTRIEEAGGAVINQRVLGVLAVSRALGDHELKNLVTGKPHIVTTELPGGTAACPLLLLCCDGVFDVMTDQETVGFVVDKYKELTSGTDSSGKPIAHGRDQYLATALARSLVQEAIKRSTRDNVTAVIALL
mmetsp:Transcript_30556/g.58856  ORF Transcript_30556/g.58856 Transcript_30556/m.58856 type:complete len:299 (+) Transcript_30556:504-1400(+)|eukprot:CAMPEP_0114251376 /NCGR_PEP_ID=MMETSP0058-20121206/15237_1 /TAXON_ID=36894 /ORGANISM="Pyramimonas parkeae, CCMP726" /LENGTH=298 /DNA_ID=CAMNT_0001365173 /DNA_START=471 /DNA_END=1367 /DNA_ORIENTATION=+